jgi:DNA-directed RNA polymerase subunit RPC12/RpoP
MTEALDYEDVMLGNIPEHEYVCGRCDTEMEEVLESPTLCKRCGKRGWDITFRCPKCGDTIQQFRQDRTDGPPCYSCD